MLTKGNHEDAYVGVDPFFGRVRRHIIQSPAGP
jgi:hypothetical protein